MATPNIKCNVFEIIKNIRWMVILMVTIQINKLLSLKVKVWKETELTISSLSELKNFGPWYRIENYTTQRKVERFCISSQIAMYFTIQYKKTIKICRQQSMFIRKHKLAHLQWANITKFHYMELFENRICMCIKITPT
jgi:hypothetical protein